MRSSILATLLAGSEVVIINMKGSKVLSVLANESTLDISSLTTGAYIVLIKKDNVVVKRRFVKFE